MLLFVLLHHNTTVDLRNNKRAIPTILFLLVIIFFRFPLSFFLCYSICCFEYKRFSFTVISASTSTFLRKKGDTKMSFKTVNLHLFMLVNDRQIEMLLDRICTSTKSFGTSKTLGHKNHCIFLRERACCMGVLERNFLRGGGVMMMAQHIATL